MRRQRWTSSGNRLAATAAVLFCASAGGGAAEGLYKTCYGEMVVAILLDVSDGATPEAARDFAARWMVRNSMLLEDGFTAVTTVLLDDLNIDRRAHESAYGRGLRQWRDCLVRVYGSE